MGCGEQGGVRGTELAGQCHQGTVWQALPLGAGGAQLCLLNLRAVSWKDQPWSSLWPLPEFVQVRAGWMGAWICGVALKVGEPQGQPVGFCGNGPW